MGKVESVRGDIPTSSDMKYIRINHNKLTCGSPIKIKACKGDGNKITEIEGPMNALFFRVYHEVDEHIFADRSYKFQMKICNDSDMENQPVMMLYDPKSTRSYAFAFKDKKGVRRVYRVHIRKGCSPVISEATKGKKGEILEWSRKKMKAAWDARLYIL